MFASGLIRHARSRDEWVKEFMFSLCIFQRSFKLRNHLFFLWVDFGVVIFLFICFPPPSMSAKIFRQRSRSCIFFFLYFFLSFLQLHFSPYHLHNPYFFSFFNSSCDLSHLSFIIYSTGGYYYIFLVYCLLFFFYIYILVNTSYPSFFVSYLTLPVLYCNFYFSSSFVPVDRSFQLVLLFTIGRSISSFCLFLSLPLSTIPSFLSLSHTRLAYLSS